MKKKLMMNDFDVMVKGELGDSYHAIAQNIEATLISSGAQAGVDYTYMDLYKLAQPIVIEFIRKGDINSFTYPTAQLEKQ